MTKDEIAAAISPEYPYVYAPTTAPTKLQFDDNSVKIGYFQFTEHSKALEANNEFTFIEYGENAQSYRATNDFKYVTIIKGDKLKHVEYPSYGSALESKLKSMLKSVSRRNEEDWDEYKKRWVLDVTDLENTIVYKLFS